MNDFRYALRGLRRSPVVAAAAVASLGLGIGASMAIFTVANAVILRSLPVKRPSELVVLNYITQKGNVFSTLGYGEYLALRDVPNALEDLAAMSSTAMNLASDEATERVNGQLVSGNYFRVLGVQPRLGRLIALEDDREAAGTPVCVIASGLWRRRFGSAPDVLGRQVRINGRQYSIAGVTPEAFTGVEQGSETQVYVPLIMAAEVTSRPADATAHPPFLKWEDWLETIGRLKPGVSRARAEAMLDARFDQLPIAHRVSTFESSNRHGPTGTRGRLQVSDGRQGFDNLRVRYERPLVILLFLVGLLLSIACANVANLLLARAAGRRKEIAIRIALGGGPWLLVRQLMAESLLLAGGGAVAGLLFSLWMSDVLVGIADAGGTRQIDARPDGVVVAFLVGVTCLTAILFGAAPAWAAVRARVALSLRSQTAGGGKRRGAGNVLVVTQVALSIMLLTGAGLLLRSLHNLQSIAPGFQSDNVLLASVNPGANRYSAERSRALLSSLLERAETIPGVKSASAVLASPLSGSLWAYSVEVAGYPAKPIPIVWFNAIGPGYFASIGSQLSQGREFTRTDRAGAPSVVVVNEAMAKKFWPGRSPLGQRFNVGGDRMVEVVGVVRDSIYRELREKQPEVVYAPLLQGDYRSATLDLRVTGDHAHVFNDLRALARQIDPAAPLFNLRTMDQQIAGTLSPERMLAMVSTIFGVLAMVLAVVGLYGVLAYAVAQRAREIGIRMALGAAQGRVIRAVIREALTMVGAGVVLGIPLSILASRWIASYLYGLKTGDPWTYVGVVAVLCAASVAAAIVPSRRAARVDPMVVLRCD